MSMRPVPAMPLPAMDIPFSYDDYVQLRESPYREEVLRGDLVVRVPPTAEHERIVRQLHRIIGEHVTERALGVLCSESTVVPLTAHDVVVPDIVFVSEFRRTCMTERGVLGPPDLIVEVLGVYEPGRDTVTKLAIYSEHGVEHYWIVDPEQRRIWLFRLDAPGEYTCVGEHADDETFAAEPFPELDIPLEQVWPSD